MTKVAHCQLEVNAMTRPMMVQGINSPKARGTNDE
jgi:hypothetical protein